MNNPKLGSFSLLVRNSTVHLNIQYDYEIELGNCVVANVKPDLLKWCEQVVAATPELAEDRTVLGHNTEHCHRHGVADQRQAGQLVTSHCKWIYLSR